MNYHSPSGAHNQGVVPGVWSDDFHLYGIHRRADRADVYWDGQLVKSYPTDDNREGHRLLLNVGVRRDGVTVYGTGSEVSVDYVRAYRPV